MALQDNVRTAMASIAALSSQFAKTVVIDGVTGTGLQVDSAERAVFTDMGEQGMKTATVRVSGAVFARPARGATILIDGAPCIVTDVGGSGVLWVIEYQAVRGVEGA
jgi:hypothetical protein